ncbi:uncharacterized protein LOC143154073 [Ptiloglossa arizonensis]|uniref:uncharacterized protein LOC143154073 n=1 Tax=Ptiloglossa arizonensis TaxID=3350558 RepID=UPI003F9EFA4C
MDLLRSIACLDYNEPEILPRSVKTKVASPSVIQRGSTISRRCESNYRQRRVPRDLPTRKTKDEQIIHCFDPADDHVRYEYLLGGEILRGTECRGRGYSTPRAIIKKHS